MDEPFPTHPELLRHAERLRALAGALLADAGAREDVVQDAWAAALGRPRGARTDLASWLAGAVRHLALKRRRRAALRAHVEQRAARAEAVEGPEEAIARAELQQRLWQTVLALDEPYRSAVVLRHLDQLEPAEIARRQGCTPAAARQRVARGLEELRRLMDADHGGRERWCSALVALARGPLTGPLPTGMVVGGVLMSSKVLLVSAALALGALVWLARDRTPEGEIASAMGEPQALHVASDLDAQATASTGGREAMAFEPAGDAGVVLEGRVVVAAAGADLASARAAAGVAVAIARGGRAPLGTEHSLPRATSAADGTFRIELSQLRARPLELRVGVHGDAEHGDVFETVRFEPGETRRGGLVLVRRELGDLAGRTLDAAGAPVPGVEVTLLELDAAGEALVPRSRAVSDSAGAFRFERARPFEELAIEKSGWVLLEEPNPVAHDDGSWEPLDLVLAAEATLRVRIEDPAGEPIAGAHVRVAIAEPERAYTDSWDGEALVRGAESDAAGTALVTGVWGGQRLVVAIARADVILLSFERVHGEQPALDDVAPGVPLVLVPGETRELGIRLATRFRFFGSVVDEHGGPVPAAHVTVRTLDGPPHTDGWVEQATTADAEGYYVLDLVAARPLGRVVVTAKDVADSPGFLFHAPETAPRAAWAERDLTGRPSGAEELTLVLAPTLAIAGRLVPGEVDATVRVHALADALPHDLLASGLPAEVYSREGAFRLSGLAPGRYDLEITPHERFATTWLRGVEAGTEGLTIELAEARPARVTVECVLPDGELEQIILLTGRLTPAGSVPTVAELPARTVIRGLDGWPPAMVSLWYGNGSRVDDTGATRFSLEPNVANPTTVELDEGLWWIGIQAKASDGTRTLPIGTGLVHVGRGDHTLRFELTRCGSVEGFVRGAEGSDLRVALAREGRLLELDVQREELAVLGELGADGWFRFPLVPVGDCELRVGTRGELLSGTAQCVREVRIEAGQTLSVTVDR